MFVTDGAARLARRLGRIGMMGLMLAALGGCGPASMPVPDGLAPVTGVVTLDGEPLAGAVVSYVPLASSGGPALDAGAITNEQGMYELHCGAGDGVGAAPGEYRVVISRLVKADGSLAMPDKDKSPMQLTLEGAKETVPPVYSDLAFGRLKASVPAGGGKFDFPLVTN